MGEEIKEKGKFKLKSYSFNKDNEEEWKPDVGPESVPEPTAKPMDVFKEVSPNRFLNMLGKCEEFRMYLVDVTVKKLPEDKFEYVVHYNLVDSEGKEVEDQVVPAPWEKFEDFIELRKMAKNPQHVYAVITSTRNVNGSYNDKLAIEYEPGSEQGAYLRLLYKVLTEFMEYFDYKTAEDVKNHVLAYEYKEESQYQKKLVMDQAHADLKSRFGMFRR